MTSYLMQKQKSHIPDFGINLNGQQHLHLFYNILLCNRLQTPIYMKAA